MSISIDSAINLTKQIEESLSTKFSAEGRGLHEKATSAEEHLNPHLLNKIRKVASIRNKLAHEVGYKVPSNIDFEKLCHNVVEEINEITADVNEKSQYELELFKVTSPPLSPMKYFLKWVWTSYFWALSIIYFLFSGAYLILSQNVSDTSLLYICISYILVFIYRSYAEIKEYQYTKLKYKISKTVPVERYTFDQSRFTRISDADPEPTIVNYSCVKKIQLKGEADLHILVVDRGVTEEFILDLTNCSETPKYICQKVYSIVFKIPS